MVRRRDAVVMIMMQEREIGRSGATMVLVSIHRGAVFFFETSSDTCHQECGWHPRRYSALKPSVLFFRSMLQID